MQVTITCAFASTQAKNVNLSVLAALKMSTDIFNSRSDPYCSRILMHPRGDAVTALGVMFNTVVSNIR